MKLLFSPKGDYELRVNMHDLVEKTLKFYTESFQKSVRTHIFEFAQTFATQG